MVLGGRTFAGPVRTVDVRRGGRRVTGTRDDGLHRGRDGLRFRIARGGREVRRFSANLTAFCVGATIQLNRIVAAFAVLRSAAIAPDGSVLDVERVGRGTRVELRGRLRRGVFRGSVDVSFSTCSGSTDLVARRVGR